MKRLFMISILALSYLLIDLEALPAPCYGTWMPQKKEIYIGVQTHSIFKRYLEAEYGKVRTLQHFLLLSYGVTDWLSIDLKGGAGYIKQRPPTSSEVDYPTGFSGGYGFRMLLYENREAGIKAIWGFQHISVHPKKIHLEGQKNSAVLDDWQVSLLLSCDFSRFTPYLGTKWSRVDYIHWIGDNRKRRMSDLTKSVGIVAGVDLPLDKKTYINLEAQFIDEEAVSLAFLYKF